ncbi:unnamed protein product [Ambrosiozyma monospora]|uniref:Unnamed protein product n=1 Tax=Ambrosiozyma monospora TaxID=43982 RepID=A0ACB5SSK6_AMBMO|nr:unnamed protein product [Ambrosiozyma monospora]
MTSNQEQPGLTTNQPTVTIMPTPGTPNTDTNQNSAIASSNTQQTGGKTGFDGPFLNAKTLTLHWHANSLPVYSVDFQPNRTGKRSARLATAGGDNNVRIWKLVYDDENEEGNKKTKNNQQNQTGNTKEKVEGNTGITKKLEEIKTVEYLSTLAKHTQAVNCVRFDPSGELLASASDDGTIMIWALSEKIIKDFGAEDTEEVKESWYLKKACRSSSSSEIYDISWSPDSKYICCGSMDNIVRVYNVTNGLVIKQIAEHNHYVQGVSWDPRNEFICSQSADRSVHIYKVLSEQGNDLSISPTTFYKITRAELPTGRLPPPPASPQPHPNGSNNNTRLTSENLTKKNEGFNGGASTPTPSISMSTTPSNSTSMDPPPQTPRHKRTYSNSSAGSITRCASPLPLPAVMPTSAPSIYKTYHLYHNETLQSFFRRLSFSPDGMLLFTASGVYKESGAKNAENNNNNNNNNNNSSNEELLNTVYIHTRFGLNKPPVAHLPGFKKPAIAIRFSPVIYKPIANVESAFKMPYRMVFCVATQDSVLIYDTQRLKPLGIVSNIHYAVITDACWSSDGKTVMISSADGFVSSIVIDGKLLGEVETYDVKKFIKDHPLPFKRSSGSGTMNCPITGVELKKSPVTSRSNSFSSIVQQGSSNNSNNISAHNSAPTSVMSSPKPNKILTTMEVIDITDVENNDDDDTSSQMPATPTTASSISSSVTTSITSATANSSVASTQQPERKKQRIQPTLISTGLVKTTEKKGNKNN